MLVNVPMQEGSQRKSSEAIAEEIGAKSPTRSAAKGLAQSFQFIINKFNTVIISFFNFIRTAMTLNFKLIWPKNKPPVETRGYKPKPTAYEKIFEPENWLLN